MKTQSRNICLKLEYFQVQLTALNVFTVHVTCSRRGMENAIRSKLLRKDSSSGKQRDKCETKVVPRILNLQKVCIGSDFSARTPEILQLLTCHGRFAKAMCSPRGYIVTADQNEFSQLNYFKIA